MSVAHIGISFVNEIEYAKGFDLREAERSFRWLAEDQQNTESARAMYLKIANMIKEKLGVTDRGAAGMTVVDMPLEERARMLFESTRNGMGWPDPEWTDLAEETRENYRREALEARRGRTA